MLKQIRVFWNAARLVVLALLVGSGAHAQQRSVTATWDASTTPEISGYHIYRRATQGTLARLNAALLTARNFVDETVATGLNYFYAVTAVIPGDPVPPPPPPPPPPQTNLPKVGDRIRVLANANIRPAGLDNGFATPIYAVQPTNSLGVVTAVSAARVPNQSSVAVWIEIKFDSCVAAIPGCTGWMGSNNMAVVTTPPPPPPPPDPEFTYTFIIPAQTITPPPVSVQPPAITVTPPAITVTPSPIVIPARAMTIKCASSGCVEVLP